MAFAMKKQTNQTWKGIVLVGLATWGSLASAASCSPREARRGERVEHPVEPGPPASPPLTSSSTATAAASTSAPATADPRDRQAPPCRKVEPWRPPPPSVDERPWYQHQVPTVGLSMSPPPRALSQNVPDQACSDDLECGDGFCDRGRCAPIWEDRYGQKCDAACPCAPYLCLEGRCRSCLHHAECGGDVCAGGMIRLNFVYACGSQGLRMSGLPPEPVRPLPPTVTPAPQVMRPSPSEIYEQRSGRKLSRLDKVIMDDCPERAWSKNVPKRNCTKDSQCGDGFCDQGRCAAIWTCGVDYGNSCEKQDHCGSLPCIDGRCRSCVSEADCDWKRGRAGESNVTCRGSSVVAGARECGGATTSIAPSSQHN
jgi:hypothetical protein